MAIDVFKQNSQGHIINVSSIAAGIPIPYQAHYSATKAALSAYTISVSSEISSHGINVTLIEPGDIKTNFTENRILYPESQLASERIKELNFLKKLEEEEITGASPELILKQVMSAIEDNSEFRVLRPSTLIQGIGIKILLNLPTTWQRYIFKKFYGI